MKSRIKSFSISVLLITGIVVSLWIGYVAFIGGPARAYEREDSYHLEAMIAVQGYEKASLINRFSFDDVYYIVEAENDGETFLVWFNQSLEIIEENDLVSYDPITTIATNFGFEEDEISLGVYNKRLVYVLKNRKMEKFFDIESLDLVYDRGSGI